MPLTCLKIPSVKSSGRGRIGTLAAAAVALVILCCAYPHTLQAACFANELTLFAPGVEKGQLALVYSVVSEASRNSEHKPVVLKHKPGRGGGYALGALVDADTDGCFLAGMQLPNYMTVAKVRGSLYRETDISPLLVFGGAPLALWVDADGPYTSVSDLIRYARSIEGQPGGVLRLAGSGSYTDHHMANLIFEREAGVKTAYLPMSGTRDTMAIVKRGEAKACWAYAFTPESMPGMKAVAVAGKARSAVLSDVPTFAELDIPIERITWFGLAMDDAVPEQTRRQAARTLGNLLVQPHIQASLAATGCTPTLVGFDALPDFLKAISIDVNRVISEYAFLP